MKKTLMILGMLSVAVSYAQQGRVGINTENPNATLEVAGLPTNTAVLDGIIAPRLTGDQLGAKTYTANQTGALVYATAAAGTLSGQVVNVDTAGYYYFDGSVWVKFAGGSSATGGENIYTVDGTLEANRTVTQEGKTLTFTGTAEGATKFVNTTGTATAQVAPVQIQDGGQAENKVLTSDATGNATWQLPKVPLQVIDVSNAGQTVFPAGKDENLRKLGITLEVPPGKWWYTMQVGFEAAPMSTTSFTRGTVFLRVRVLDDAESNNGTAVLNAMEPYGGMARRQWYVSQYAFGAKYVSTGLHLNGGKSTLVGSLGINNTTGATKRFYLYADILGSADAIDGNQINHPQVKIHTGSWAETTITKMEVQ